MTVKDRILQLFEQSNELSIKEITDNLGISKQMAHLIVKKLVEERLLEKLGRPPKTIYRFVKDKILPKDNNTLSISADEAAFLQKNFILITETGNLLEGINAFEHWCNQRKLPVEKTLSEYILTKKKYEQYYDDWGIINGAEKLKSTKGYERIWLDNLYYLDFYAIERFGKTRLGTFLHYAKQGQSKFLMKIMVSEIKDRIKNFLQQQKADAIAFIPPTIRREVQLIKFMQAQLKISLPIINIKKISGIIPVPQKSLSKLEERIKNADNTFAIMEERKFNHIVLIDDAVGSGATLNQIARKLKNKGITTTVTGLAIVGSFKGFDVITDL